MWPVYLRSLSQSSDIAVFELTQAAATSGNHPPHSVPLSALSSSFTSTPSVSASGKPFKETDQAHMHLFAAYYPGDNVNVEHTDLSPVRKELAKANSLGHTWDLWSVERSGVCPDTSSNPVVSQRTSLSDVSNPLCHPGLC